MKKLLTLIGVLISFMSFAQKYQDNNLQGVDFNRTIARQAAGFPNDTLPVPAQYQNFPHMAYKNNVLYVWAPSQLKWVNAVTGGSAGITEVFGAYGLANLDFQTLAIDTLLFYNRDRIDYFLANIPSGGGGGGGTGGISKVLAGYGLTMVNDSMPEVDTGSIQKKLSYGSPVYKSNNTLGLTGYFNGDNVAYGQATSGTPTMLKLSKIDTAGRYDYDSSLIVFNRASGTHTYVPKTPGYQPPTLLQFIVGQTPLSPESGDSTLGQSAFLNKFVTVMRDGEEQFYNSELPGSYEFNSTDALLTVHPPFAYNEKIKIYITTSPPDTTSIEPPWNFITVGTNNNINIASNVYTPSVTGFNWSATYMKAAETFTGNAAIRLQHKSDAQAYILGLRNDNAMSDYPNYDVGFYINSTSGDLFKVESGAPSSLGISVAANDYVAIRRSGSTFVLQTSTNGVIWSTVYTFSYTSSAVHYVNLNLYSNSPLGKAYNIAIQ